MKQEFYSFIVEYSSDDSIVYSFLTASGVAYSVYFRPNEYDDFLNDFPNLLHNSYAFGFYRIAEPAKENKGRDEVLYATISRIIKDFMLLRGDDLVLLYHCDYADGKQKGREKLFSEWYGQSDHREKFVKQTIELELTDRQGKVVTYYIGYLTSTGNPEKKRIAMEFETLAINLVSDKDV